MEHIFIDNWIVPGFVAAKVGPFASKALPSAAPERNDVQVRRCQDMAETGSILSLLGYHHHHSYYYDRLLWYYIMLYIHIRYDWLLCIFVHSIFTLLFLVLPILAIQDPSSSGPDSCPCNPQATSPGSAASRDARKLTVILWRLVKFKGNCVGKPRETIFEMTVDCRSDSLSACWIRCWQAIFWVKCWWFPWKGTKDGNAMKILQHQRVALPATPLARSAWWCDSVSCVGSRKGKPNHLLSVTQARAAQKLGFVNICE